MISKKPSIFTQACLWILALLYAVPIVMMVFGSLKGPEEAMKFNLMPPTEVMWSNYAHVIEKGNVWTGYMNSITLTASATILVLLFGSLAGIYVGRVKSRSANWIYNYFVLGITLSFQIATTFALLKQLNIYGTHFAVIMIYTAMQLPFTVMTFASFVKGVPREIDEAALIDGCSTLGMIFRILIPIMKPIFLTNLIVVAIGCWNNFMVPLFYLDSNKEWPIPLMVYNFYGIYERDWNYVFAMLVLTIIPIVALFLCLQKYIIGGMTSGAVKG